MRHMPFAIGPRERDRWLELMAESVREAELPTEVAQILWPYFVQTANHMMNRPSQ
jgi:hemoglobin